MINIFSAFDGLGLSGLAVRNVFGGDFKYYASEVEPYLMDFTRREFPNIIHLGDIKRVVATDMDQIDYFICSSPCQDLSPAGKRKGISGERSGLFWEALRLRDEIKPKYWLFENVISSRVNLSVISEALGVDPVFINSRHFTYQDRIRAYWCNFEVRPPKHLDLKVLQNTTIRRRAFGEIRDTNYLPTLTRNVCTNAWEMSSNGISFEPIPWSVFEAAQGLPTGYTSSLPNVKRRLAIANSFTLPVIEYIIQSSMLT